MSTKRNRSIVARLYEEGWGKGNLDVIEEVFASEHVLHWNDLKPTDQLRTAAEVRDIVRDYWTAFPDLSVTVDDMVAEGDNVAVQVTFAGTHTGVYEGFPPTHRWSRFTDMPVLRMREGKIIESSLGSGGLQYFFSLLSGAGFDENGKR